MPQGNIIGHSCNEFVYFVHWEALASVEAVRIEHTVRPWVETIAVVRNQAPHCHLRFRIFTNL